MKKQGKKTVDQYLDRGGEVFAKTIRATDKLWERVEKLAGKKDVSVNLMVVVALEKICDEEGIY